MFFSEDGVFIPSVLCVSLTVMDGPAAHAAETLHAPVLDPDRPSFDQLYCMGRTAVLACAASHTLVIHPEFLCLSALFIKRIDEAGNGFSFPSRTVRTDPL